MTTAVTVDAHAGWPVKVTLIDQSSDGLTQSETVQVVAANTKQAFYVWNGRDIKVHELQPGEVSEE